MENRKITDLIDLLTMSFGEISSMADVLATALYHECNDKEIYKAAYAIKTMVLNLEEKSLVIAHDLKSKMSEK